MFAAGEVQQYAARRDTYFCSRAHAGGQHLDTGHADDADFTHRLLIVFELLGQFPFGKDNLASVSCGQFGDTESLTSLDASFADIAVGGVDFFAVGIVQSQTIGHDDQCFLCVVKSLAVPLVLNAEGQQFHQIGCFVGAAQGFTVVVVLCLLDIGVDPVELFGEKLESLRKNLPGKIVESCTEILAKMIGGNVSFHEANIADLRAGKIYFSIRCDNCSKRRNPD